MKSIVFFLNESLKLVTDNNYKFKNLKLKKFLDKEKSEIVEGKTDDKDFLTEFYIWISANIDKWSQDWNHDEEAMENDLAELQLGDWVKDNFSSFVKWYGDTSIKYNNLGPENKKKLKEIIDNICKGTREFFKKFPELN